MITHLALIHGPVLAKGSSQQVIEMEAVARQITVCS